MPKNKKVILLYPYFNGSSGAFNRYLLLEKLLRKKKLDVKLIVFDQQEFNLAFLKIINKFLKFLKVETLIFFYSVLRKNYFITDFNPSIIALFSKNVFIQIHDVSWANKNFIRHNLFFYRIFNFFIKNYTNILTVSKNSISEIIKVSGRNKRISFLYNSVSESFINESRRIGKDSFILQKNNDNGSIDFSLPNLLYIATLTPRKCHADLLEALSNTNKLFNVNLIGFPTDKKILEYIQTKKSPKGNYIKSNINFFPKVSQNYLCNLLLYCSAYISTSMEEGFGIPVLEAQVYKVPIILRDLNINRELFPKATFFKSTFQLSNLLSDIKLLSESEIKERKEIASMLNEDNINNLFNYSILSKKLQSIIFNHY